MERECMEKSRVLAEPNIFPAGHCSSAKSRVLVRGVCEHVKPRL